MSRLIKIGGHTCRVLRISYIGELGYELHIPQASCVPVFHKVMEAGRGFDLKHAGFRALDSLSCEKGKPMYPPSHGILFLHHTNGIFPLF